MKEYHKIQTAYKRDPKTKHKTLRVNDYTLPEFEFLQNIQWVFTEKVEGTNIRVLFQKDSISFGGKTDNGQIPVHLLNALNAIFLPQSERMATIFTDGSACLYGEGYGPKIQKGGGKYRKD